MLYKRKGDLDIMKYNELEKLLKKNGCYEIDDNKKKIILYGIVLLPKKDFKLVIISQKKLSPEL